MNLVYHISFLALWGLSLSQRLEENEAHQNISTQYFDSKGIVYIYWRTHRSQCTGGVAALHELHDSLLKLRSNYSYYYQLTDCYPEFKGNNVEHFEDLNLSKDDIIIIPEVFTTDYLRIQPSLQEKMTVWTLQGVRIFVFALAALQLKPPDMQLEIPVHVR